MKNGRQTAAVAAITQGLIRLAETQGINAAHTAYADAISAIMAEETRSTWKERITEAQRDTFALLEAN